MAGALRDSFLADLRCSEAEAELLAALARERVPAESGSPDDAEEDLVVRLRDPRTYGGFAETVLANRRLSRGTRIAFVEGAFDLLPLPHSEGDVILVESRAPRRLLALAGFLAREEGLTVLHAMHLLYAVFLDRGLVTAVERPVRSAVLDTILALPEAGERLKTLYACLHLAAVPSEEAYAELRRSLRSRAVPDSVKGPIASIVSSVDGGLGELASLAQEEGLLPAESEDLQDPSVVANIPRMPSELAALGRRWSAARGGR